MRALVPLLLLAPLTSWASPGSVPGHVIIDAPGMDDEAAAALARSRGCQLVRRLGGWHPYLLLRCAPDSSPTVLADAFAGAPGVRAASPDLVGRLHAVPDDDSSAQWHHDTIGSYDAWDVSTGDPAVVVAVIDVGVWAEHEDLADNAWANAAETDCSDGVDDDSNGFVDDCWGWDGGEDDGDPSPIGLPSDCPPFHGTFAAGLLGAVGDNGVGMAGVNWELSVMGIKMVSDDCLVSQASIVDSVLYAADNGAQVANMSFSFSSTNSIMENTFRYADGLGMISAISAGNDGADLDSETWYPAHYGLEHGLVVAATDSSDARASWSNYGASTVHLAAPGSSMYSLGTDSSSDYETSQGTSFSAPLVAGAAALVWAAYPELHPDEVVASIYDGVEPISSLDCASSSTCVESGGRLDLPGALAQAALWMEHVELELVEWSVDDLGGSAVPGDGVLERGETAELVITMENSGHAPSGAQIQLALDGAHDDIVFVHQDTLIEGLDAGEQLSFTAFEFDYSPNCEEDGQVVLTLEWSDTMWGSWAELELPLVCIVDEDEDGHLYPDDCDDLDPAVFPGAEELCNGVDDDCDDATDEDPADAATWYGDADGDGFGDPDDERPACEQPSDAVEDASDCDDGDGDIHPDADEICDGLDNDCDALTDDEDDAVVAPLPWYPDSDGDGLGSDDGVIHACAQPDGFAAEPGDCDDSDPTRTTDCSEPEPEVCGCSAHPRRGLWWLALLALLGPARRRRI